MLTDPFVGASEMARLMRDYDWAQTPLGPPASWPRSLQTVVRVILTSRYAMWMGWGPDLTFFYNDAYGAMTLGAKHPWALGRPSREVWAEIWPQIGPRIERVLSTGEATWDEALQLFLERSGYPEETYHTFSYSPLADDDGAIRGHLCVVTEETDRVIGERRLATLNAVAAAITSANTEDALGESIAGALGAHARDLPFALAYLTDEDQQQRFWASSGGADEGIRRFPWPFGTVLATGEPLIVDLPPSLAAPAGPWPAAPRQAILAPIAAQGQVEPAGVLVAGLNAYRAIDDACLTFVKLVVGQIAGGLGNVRSYEAERRRAEALAEIDRAKTLFFSNVSHEFRTPLTLLLGPLEDALGAAPRRLEGTALETSYRNALRLLKLVNALLDFARLEAGRTQARFQPTDLAVLTSEVASAFRAAIEHAGLTFRVSCEPSADPVYVDRDMWEKVVLNLLSNALKFTFEGEVAISVRIIADRAELVVQDTGIGIAADELPRLFERFHRVEGARARTHEGSGIGLALVHELTRVHGGTIVAASTPGRGTTFTVTLPLGTAHLSPDQIVTTAPPSTGAAIRSRAFVEEALRWLPDVADVEEVPTGAPAFPESRLLVADDNADMRAYIARLLAPICPVEVVTNGHEALDALRRNGADVVLTDVMMPGMDGLQLLRAIRTDPTLQSTAVIVLSARSGDEARIEGLEAGADDYLFKPFSARELVARVSSHLQLARARHAAAVERETAREQAESATRAKDEFLAMLGHELRNPLAPILTALELMRLKGLESREQDLIRRQVGHLTRLVDDLLDVSRITRGKIELTLQPIELASVVARAIELASPLLEQREHRVTVDVASRGLGVSGDADRLAQVVVNLLTNAAKYSDPRSLIRIAASRVGPDVELRVRDLGVGIAPEMLGQIFDPFVQQSQTLERARGGLGLGLTIVRSLVEKHGGTVFATSAGPGTGSEFVIRLPFVPVEGVAAAEEPVRRPLEPRTEHVLVVDDNQDAAEMLQATLQHLGYIVVVAHDAPTALEQARRREPDIALLDIGLPVMDGYELADRLRQQRSDRPLRLIAVTGYGQEQDRARSRAAGFAEHLVKPIALDALQAALSGEPA